MDNSAAAYFSYCYMRWCLIVAVCLDVNFCLTWYHLFDSIIKYIFYKSKLSPCFRT
jgi:hypothetical protein